MLQPIGYYQDGFLLNTIKGYKNEKDIWIFRKVKA
jgi:hypothetical protein